MLTPLLEAVSAIGHCTTAQKKKQLGVKDLLRTAFFMEAGGQTRTPDRLITNQLLYQLSYTSKLF
jgi:hypothetical protein